MSFEQELKQHVEEIEAIIDRYLPKEEGLQKTVIEAMNYTIKAGGKRLRPMLMLETYRKFGGADSIIEPFMAAIEMIHTYSLVHDDLPALDNDDYRRGRKTAHVVFGEDMAILAGDALQNYAFEVAAAAFGMDEQNPRIGRAFQVLASKSGIYGMIGGQTADVELTGKPLTMEQILFIHDKKTAALLECAMMIGAILAGANPTEIYEVEQAAKDLGLAFQIEDDILDQISTQEVLGKPVHSDERNQKTTYVSIRGMEQSKLDVENRTNHAISRLNCLRGENEFLVELMEYLVNRNK